jgi:hypothetical protein
MNYSARSATLRVALPVLAAAATALPAGAESLHDGRPAAVYETTAAKLVIDLGGGSIVDFRLAKDGLNPLRWLGPGHEKLTLRPMAHFVCLDRWGQPSQAEQSKGMPFHGEATSVRWEEVRPPTAEQGYVTGEMKASLPLAGLEIRRIVRLAAQAPVFTVTEVVTNRNRLGRAYNMVQHPTIGPPFLDESVIVDANAGKGLMQSSPLPNPEEPAIWWPLALGADGPVDLRRLHADPAPPVTSFVVEGEHGWVTAVNPSRRLLLGYLWKTADYPWLNIWRHVIDGKPLARGLEFGTTGLHQPFEVLLSKGSIFGRRLFSYLDAGQSAGRSYAAFLLETPPGFAGVRSLSYKDGRIVLREQASTPRELAIEAVSLF